MRHDPWFAGDQLEQFVVDLHPIQRGEPQPGQAGAGGKDGRDQRAEAGRIRQIVAPTGEIDPGEHHFGNAAVGKGGDLAGDFGYIARAAGAAPLRDDAEAAGVIAAGLHADKGAGVAGWADGRGRGGRQVPGSRIELCGIGDEAINLGHGGDAVAINLGRAAGDQQAGVGAGAAGAANGLTGLAQGLAGDRAGIDDDEMIAAGGWQGAGAEHGAQGIAFRQVQPAAQRDDLEAHSSAP